MVEGFLRDVAEVGDLEIIGQAAQGCDVRHLGDLATAYDTNADDFSLRDTVDAAVGRTIGVKLRKGCHAGVLMLGCCCCGCEFQLFKHVLSKGRWNKK